MIDPEAMREQRAEARRTRDELLVDVACRRKWTALVRSDRRTLAEVAALDNTSVVLVREGIRQQLVDEGRPSSEIDRLLTTGAAT